MTADQSKKVCKVIPLFNHKAQPGEDTETQTPSADDKGPNHQQINEDMWSDTRKRHCESREHVRSLLDRHLRPH